MKPFAHLLAESVALIFIATLAGCSNTKFTDVRIVPYPDGKGGVLYGTNRTVLTRRSMGNKVAVGEFSLGSTNGTSLQMKGVVSDTAAAFIAGVNAGKEIGQAAITKAP